MLSNDDVDVLIKNCTCQLGDVIDDRHMSWIQLSTAQTGTYLYVFLYLCVYINIHVYIYICIHK
jgi:hypothetical protein